MIFSKMEIFDPIKDFLKIKTWCETIIYYILPVFIGGGSFILINLCSVKNDFQLYSFTNDFLNALITVMALFISFSMAYLTILITSSSKNVDELKTRTSSLYIIDKKPVFLFQILLVDITYTVIMEVLLLVLAFIQKFLILISDINVIKFYMVIDVILLIHIILLLLRSLTNVYFAFWKSR